MHSFRIAAAALAATATIASPLATATATTADAAGQAGPVIALDVDWYGVAFSPNGDHSQDKARITFTLARKSEVIVKIRRTNEARTLVYKEKLGVVTRGDHTWVWNGKNRNGKIVKDGHYTAGFVADQVAEDGRKQNRGTAVYVDTTFDATWAPRLSADTVYPNTAGYPTDFVGLTLGNDPDDPMTALGKVAEIVTDAEGRVVSKQRPFPYLSSGYYYSMPLSFRGRDAANNPLPAGTYGLRFTVRDLAGNPGGTQTVTVNVSDRPLVETTGYVVVAPTGPSVPAGRSSRRGGDDVLPVPCGTVVASEVYADPGAMSFRSSDACGGTWGRPSLATAGGGVDLASILPPEVAPRGLRTSWVSMRGKPTVAGETDSATLIPMGGYIPGGSSATSSAAVAEESVTTTPPVSYPFEAPYFSDYARGVRWMIETRGTDSFDVAAVTVYFTYLTPQQ